MPTEAINDVANDLVRIGRHWTTQQLPPGLTDSIRTRITGAAYSLVAHIQEETWLGYMAMSPKDEPGIVIGSGRAFDERIGDALPDRYLIRHGLQDLDLLGLLLTGPREPEFLDQLREMTGYHAEAHPGQPTTAVMGWFLTDVIAMIHRHYQLRLDPSDYGDEDIAPYLAAALAARWSECTVNL